MVSFYALPRRLKEAIDIYDTCLEKSCGMRLWIVKNLMQDKYCALRGCQNFDISSNRKGLFAPCIETAGKRSNIFEPSPVECQGYARARNLAWTRAVKNDLSVGRKIRIPVSLILLQQVGVDSNGPRNRHQFLSLLRAALQVQDQNIFVAAQFAHQLIRRDPREPEFAQESVPAKKLEDDENADRCNSSKYCQRSQFRRIGRDAVQLITESPTQSRISTRPNNCASAIKGQKSRPVSS